MDWVWVLIPITAILAGTGVLSQFAKALGGRRSNADADANQKALENEVKALKQDLVKQKEAYERRLANLETIVTSQTWDVLGNPSLSDADKRFLTSDIEKPTQDDEQRAELLAQKLK